MARSTTSEARQDPPTINADLQSVAHRIHKEFDARLDPQTVDECLHRVAARFDGARVRSFVPLLVRRYVSEELRNSLKHA